MLVRAAFEVLDLLSERYVLKASQGRAAVTYELVHDGFGPALFEWAERERLKLSDTLASNRDAVVKLFDGRRLTVNL